VNIKYNKKDREVRTKTNERKAVGKCQVCALGNNGCWVVGLDWEGGKNGKKKYYINNHLNFSIKTFDMELEIIVPI